MNGLERLAVDDLAVDDLAVDDLAVDDLAGEDLAGERFRRSISEEPEMKPAPASESASSAIASNHLEITFNTDNEK